MTRWTPPWSTIIAVALVAFAVLAVVVGEGPADISRRIFAAPTPTAAASVGGCTAGDYPDRVCTPGAVNADVRQDNIGTTICTPGWSTKTRARLFPSSAAARVKIERMAAYAVSGKADYELDHLVPIEDGGAVDQVANLWPEPWAGAHGAHAKDVVENRVHADICAGRITLAQGQAVFLTGAQW